MQELESLLLSLDIYDDNEKLCSLYTLKIDGSSGIFFYKEKWFWGKGFNCAKGSCVHDFLQPNSALLVEHGCGLIPK